MKSHRNRFGTHRLFGKSSRRVSVFRKFSGVHLEHLELRTLLTGSPLLAQWENVADADANETLPAARAILASSCAARSSTTPLSSSVDASAGTDLPTSPDVPLASPAAVDDVMAEPLIAGQVAEFKLVTEDLAGQLITSINVGQDFKLSAYVKDLRDPPNQLPGVWAAFMDIVYTSSLVTITPGANPPSDPGNNSDSAITWGDYFDTGLRFGDLDVDGQITGIGSSSLALTSSGTGDVKLFSVVVHADAAGVVSFTPSFDAAANHESSFLNPPDVFEAGNIKFTATDLTINGPPTVSIAPSVSQNEGNSGTTNYLFTVTLSEAATQQATVVYNTSNGSATAGQDYTATSGTLTFGVGDTSKVITVAVSGDTTNEADENFTVTLSSPVNAVLATAVTGLGTIVNDDSSVLSIANVSKLEGNAAGTMVFTVTLSGAAGTNIVVPWTTENVVGNNAATGSSGTSGDYQHTSGTLTFLAGNTSPQFITVNINGDTVNEANEDFRVVLTQPANVTFDSSNGQALGTILNDDGPHITITQSVTQQEGNSGTVAYVFTVDLGVASDVPVTVQFATQDGTAMTANSDYTGTSGTLSFEAGDTQKTITVLVNGDALNEGNETFQVKLSNPSAGATLTSDTGTGTIENDDAVPSISFSSSTVSLAEGDSAMLFTVNLSAASGQNVTVQFATANGSATTADGDYTATSGTLTFLAGETQKVLTVLIKADTKDEVDESFTLNLSAPSQATLGSPAASVGTIEDNDGPPTASIGNSSVVESNSGEVNMVFTITLSAASGQAITIPFSTADDTATTADNDYTATSGTLTIAAGSTTGTITVKVKGDTKNEPNEVFKVNLNQSGATNVTIADGSADGTITNDEALPTVSITNGTPKNEGNSGTTEFFFTVNLSASSSQTLTVNYTTVDGTATTTNDDYTGQNGTLTFEAGQTQKIITVLVKGDTRFEADETFNVVISSPSAGMTLGQASGSGLILNDDEKPTISIGDVTKLEGDSGTTDFVFQVTLSSASGLPVTVVYSTANGTATTTNNDYTATSGTLTFTAGVTTQTVTVKVIGDNFQESNETFSVNLSNPNANATIADGTGTGTIQNEASDNVVVQPSSIRGYAFVDTNKNNVRDPHERPMAGVPVTLEGVSNLTNQDVKIPGITLADGSYAFENIDPGTYQITFDGLEDYKPAKVIENSAQLEPVPDDGGPAAYVATLAFPGNFNIIEANFASVGLKPERVSQRAFVASTMGSNSNGTAPSVVLSTATTQINSSNAASTSVSGTGTVGATISVVASNNGTSTAAKTTTVGANGTWSITGINVTSLADGTVTYTATASTPNGTATATKTAPKDTAAPAVSITSVTTPINGGNFSNASASGTGEAGASISVTVSDGTNTTPAVTTTVAANGTWSVSGLNLSNLKDGTVSYTARATDAAGNVASNTSPGTKSALSVDLTTVTAINNANKANLSASGTGQIGTTVSVVVTDGTNTSAAKTATVGSNGSWSVTGIDATSLADGNVTYRVTATNTAGDSVQDTQSSTKDTVAPNVTMSAATAPINNSNVTNASASGTGEVGATIQLKVTDGLTNVTPPTTTVGQDGTWSITGINLTTLINGNISFQAQATDAAGNVSIINAGSTRNTVKDVIVPTVQLNTVTEAIGLGNQTNVAASGTIGSGETGTVTITLVISDGTDSITKTTTLTGGATSWSITAIDVSELSDGTLTFTATASDAAGNVSTPSSKTATKTALVVNAYTSAVNIANQAAASINGTGQVGAEVSVTVTDGTTTTQAATTTVGAGGTWSITGLNLSSLDDGDLTYSVTATLGSDVSTVTKAATKITVAPTAAFTSVPETINNNNKTNVSVSGTGTVGATIALTVTDGATTLNPFTTTVGAGGTWSISGIDVSTLDDGTLTFTAVATDSVGNESSDATDTALLDTLPPTAAITTVDDPLPTANLANLSASGTGDVGATVTVVARNGLQSSAPVTVVIGAGGTWTVNGIDVTGLADGTITFAATAEDAAGNTSAESTIDTTKDTTPPAVSNLVATDPVNAANVTAASISGTSEEGVIVKVSVTDGVVTTNELFTVVAAGGSWTISNINLAALADGPITYVIIATDAAGNASNPIELDADKDTIVPTVALVDVPAVVNSTNVTAVAVSGTGTVGATVSVTVTDGTTTTAAVTTTVDAQGNWTITGLNLSALTDTTLTFNAVAEDAAGNGAASSLTAPKDTAAPSVVILNSTDPINAANVDDVGINGTTEAGATVSLVISDGPHETSTFTVVAAGDGTWSFSGLNVSALDDGLLTYLVFATDASGNEGDVEFDTATKDVVTAVEITSISPLNIAGISNVTVTGTGEPGASIALSIFDGDATLNETATVDGQGNWSISGIDLGMLADGPITFTATATDAVNNTDTDTSTPTMDTVAPDLSVDSVTDPISAGNAANTSVGGTATAGAHLLVVVSDGTNSISQTLDSVPQDGNWTISGLDVSAFFDGTITYTVTATDDAGNETVDSITATASGLASGAPLASGLTMLAGQNSGNAATSTPDDDCTASLADQAMVAAADGDDWDLQLCEVSDQLADDLTQGDDGEDAEAAADAALEQFAGLSM